MDTLPDGHQRLAGTRRPLDGGWTAPIALWCTTAIRRSGGRALEKTVLTLRPFPQGQDGCDPPHRQALTAPERRGKPRGSEWRSIAQSAKTMSTQCGDADAPRWLCPCRQRECRTRRLDARGDVVLGAGAALGPACPAAAGCGRDTRCACTRPQGPCRSHALRAIVAQVSHASRIGAVSLQQPLLLARPIASADWESANSFQGSGRASPYRLQCNTLLRRQMTG